MPRVFLITGTSSGFGKCLVDHVLAQGDIAVATARSPEKLSFKGTNEKNYLAAKLDVLDKASIKSAFASAVQRFGRVDVVVNNAGNGLGGEFESLSDAEIRTQMDVNFFGVLDVTRAALETMRAQRPAGGLVQQVTSYWGQVGEPLVSIYSASKWAVEGFTEAVAGEVKPEWGIRFQLVEPGAFRTDWAGRSLQVAEGKHPDYGHVDVRAKLGATNGTQPGDPVKAAARMYELATMAEPPLRCVLGSDAFGGVQQKLDRERANLQKLASVSTSTDLAT